MYWRELTLPDARGAFPTLALTVEPGDLPPGPPPFRVEQASGARIRVVSGERPLLWGRVPGAHYGYWRLAADVPADAAVSPLAPITAEVLRAIEPAPRTAAWWSAWARWFARALLASPRTPLHRGEWQLMQGVPIEFERVPHYDQRDWDSFVHVPDVRAALTRPPYEWERYSSSMAYQGALLAVRAASAPDAARVRAWRKHARAGTLPPVLAMGISGLTVHVLLDGHDRLQAALREGMPPPLMVLWHVRIERDEAPPEAYAAARAKLALAEPTAAQWGAATVREMNWEYLWAYRALALRGRITRAFPISGGRAQWDREVGAPPAGSSSRAASPDRNSLFHWLICATTALAPCTASGITSADGSEQ